MSLYNMMYGVNTATFYILPMLGKHPDEYPRFRDCFVSDCNTKIEILTRTGGGNREAYEKENEEMTKMENYISDCDDYEDNTYVCWVFSVPEEFKDDFQLVMDGKLKETSKEYKERLHKIYPKLKEQFDKVL